MRRTLSRLVGLTLPLLLVAACAGEDEPSEVEPTPITVPQDEGASGATGADEGPEATGTAEEPRSSDEVLEAALAAIAAAEQTTGGTAFEIDTSDGAWEVTVAVNEREHEVRVDNRGERVLSERDADSLDDDDRAGLAAATITLGDALRAAVGEVPGVLDEAALDDEDGGYTWEVSLRVGDREPEVHVDVTGGITGVDRD